MTYATQRSYALDRVDSQLESATLGLERQFDDQRPPFEERAAPADGLPRGGGAPSETYGQQRNRSGNCPRRRLPEPERDRRGAGAAGGHRGRRAARPSRPRTGDYRVLATPARDGTITVAAIPMSATNQTLERLLLVEGIVIVVVLVLVGGFALVVVRVGLLPLDRMGHTAAAIAGGDLSHRVETTDQRTEVGRLGLALNRMLDRLEDAFAAREASQERLRRFIADASHELRTPLVSIRGYAELFRMGAAREPEDVAKAMRRIEDEAARMGVLVEDLLTLARLDEVRAAPHGAVDLQRAGPRRRRRRARDRARARDHARRGAAPT